VVYWNRFHLVVASDNLREHLALWLIYVPSASNFKTFHFLFMSVFMYVVWELEQTAIIPVHDINWVVFITQCLLRGTN